MLISLIVRARVNERLDVNDARFWVSDVEIEDPGLHKFCSKLDLKSKFTHQYFIRSS